MRLWLFSCRNLAANKFEGNIPSSLPWLHSLKYLWVYFLEWSVPHSVIWLYN